MTKSKTVDGTGWRVLARATVLAATLLSLSPAALRAQDGLPRRPSPEPASRGVSMAVGGALLGGLGLVGGAALGAALERGASSSCYDYCGLGGGMIGGALGESFGVALGVHLSNGSRGSLAASSFASIGIAAAGVSLLALTGDGAAVPILITVPIAQVAAAMGIERATMPRFDSEE